MQARTHSSGQRKHRRGSLTVELLLVLPILLVLLFAMVQFSMVISAREQLVAASREGARVAARGGDDEEVLTAVEQVLGHGTLRQARTEIQVLPEDPRHPDSGRQRVEVTVHIPSNRVAPGFLRWLTNPDNDSLVARTVMLRE